MQGKSYTKNYIKTYLWQGTAVFLNLLSMFIVVPMLTTNQVVYGIYAICISAAMFLSYADLGFVKAGLKYAGESFARGNKSEEISYYGFSGFLLTIFVAFFAGTYFLFSLYPELLIKEISSAENTNIASKLLFIQAIFSFNTIFQRLLIGICSVRIENYIYQRINILGSMLKIAAVYYFFGYGKYDIVGYFLFIKCIDLAVIVGGFIVIMPKYELSLSALFKSFRFNTIIFRKLKSLAIGSLFVTIMWILYYELDIIVIGKMFGAKSAAIFALAFTFMKFLRSFSGIMFSPFQDRFNHFVGLNDMEGLKGILEKVIRVTMPVFVILIASIAMLSENIILCWAGIEFANSTLILLLLAINYAFVFIVVPGSNLIVSMERIKEIYKINFFMVAVFWIGIFVTYQTVGLISFPLFKLIAGFISVILYLQVILKFLNISIFKFVITTISPIILPLLVQVLFLFFLRNYLPDSKGLINLGFVIGIGAIGFVIGFITLYLSSNYYRGLFLGYLSYLKGAKVKE